jgi:hypothetical protein
MTNLYPIMVDKIFVADTQSSSTNYLGKPEHRQSLRPLCIETTNIDKLEVTKPMLSSTIRMQGKWMVTDDGMEH